MTSNHSGKNMLQDADNTKQINNFIFIVFLQENKEE